LGILVCPCTSVRKTDWDLSNETTIQKVESRLRYPVFVKPPGMGSSIGISRVENRENLAYGLNRAFQYAGKAVVEQGIVAREFAVGVIGNQVPVVSGPGEFMLNDTFYDYEAKFGESSLDDLVPAPIPAAQRTALQKFALSVYRRLSLNGMARIDCFLTENNEILLNEINTVPGLSAPAVFIRQWEATGLAPGELFHRIVRYGIEYCNADTRSRNLQ
jgi:D-alanine-D-alanine ligase